VPYAILCKLQGKILLFNTFGGEITGGKTNSIIKFKEVNWDKLNNLYVGS